jgi:hypothetical protein
MAIKQNWLVNAQPYADLMHFVDSFEDMAYGLFVETAAEIEPLLLDELRHYPPVPPGSKYIRTFRLQNGWFVDIIQSGGEFLFQVGNDVEYAQFVVGSLAQAVAAAARFQRDFHKAHGWQLGAETVTFWFEAFMEEYRGRFNAELAKFGTTSGGRRASTRR